MRLQTETRTLPTELSPEELAAESQKLADAVKEADQQKDAIAEKTGLWKETKKKMDGYLAHLESEVTSLATIVDSGVADRAVECSWLYALRQGFAFLVRDDTGELVTHRKLRDDERQENLLEVLREPTAEQLETWTAALGLVLDPQGDLPLADPDGTAPEYYRRLSIPGEHGPEQIVGRFAEADHRPSSLTGVNTDGDDPSEKALADLDYDDDTDTLRTYRQALEEMLETKRAAAQRESKDRDPGEDGDAAAPTPTGQGRKGKQ